MKPLENTFEKNRINFVATIVENDLRKDGVLLAEDKGGPGSFPWDECIAKMKDEYGDLETAQKVCGMIKSKYGS